MSDSNDSKDTATGQPGKSTESEKVIERDQLIDNSYSLLGQPPHIVAGALSERQGTKGLSIKQAQQAVEKFLNREVKETE